MAKLSGENKTIAVALTPKKDRPLDIITNSIGMRFRLIRPGQFSMGSRDGNRDERPVHLVTISKPYYMGVYEVTQEQYIKVMHTNPSFFRGPDLPVENVSWEDAREFCRRLSELEGVTYRLPTEAEWEYAARGGSASWGYPYSGGLLLDKVAWYSDNAHDKTHPVGKKEPNEQGLFDMSGNVWEWCQDSYRKYPRTMVIDPVYNGSDGLRILRGGSWVSESSECRSTTRFRNNQTVSRNNYGFRVCREVSVDASR